MEAWSRPPHPLAALEAARPLCRTNPIFTEEEEQEAVIVVEENGDSPSSSPELTRTAPQGEDGGGDLPRRAPSTSSGYGSGAGSGRSTPPPRGVVPPPPPPMPGLLFAPRPFAPAAGTGILHDAISRKVSAIQTKKEALPIASPPSVGKPMFSKENLIEDIIAKQLSTAQNRKKKMKVTSRAAPVKLESIFQSTATECALGAAGVHLVAQRGLARPVAKVVPSTCFAGITPPPMPISFQEQLMLRLSQRRKDICSESEDDRASECDVPNPSRGTLSVLKEELSIVTAAEVNIAISEINTVTEEFETPELVATRSAQNQTQSLSRGSVRSKSEVRLPVGGKPLTLEQDLPDLAVHQNGDIRLQMECVEVAWEESALSSSLRADIRSWLVPRPVWPERDVSALLRDAAAAAAAGAAGAAGATLVRARLQAALRALPAAPVFDSCQAVPYRGPGVRPGDVTMMPKHTDLMTHLAASARFTLESEAGAALAARLERARARRARGRAVLALAVLALLLAAVGAAELLLTRGRRIFGATLI